MTEPGQQAPDFSLPRDGGGTVSLSQFKGRKVVLYFYPKDDTPGCTREAIAFTGQAAAFEATDTVVVGVSRDSVARHDKFKAKHELRVMLASDESGDVVERFGVWVRKKLYGRTYMGIERATFLIDRDGVITRIWRKVKVKGHAEEVLAAAQAI
ncbi:MAG: thioredoxin-dependent thiol peroxidase [Sphingomonadales bacterium]